jgi:hypothetical protein
MLRYPCALFVRSELSMLVFLRAAQEEELRRGAAPGLFLMAEIAQTLYVVDHAKPSTSYYYIAR